MSYQAPDKNLLPRSSVIIGGALSQSSGISLPHIYPATGQVTGDIRLGSPVDAAVAAARKAAPGWRALPGDKRRDLMFKLAALIERDGATLTHLCTVENGNAISGTMYMNYDGAQKSRYVGGWADKIQGRTISTWGGQAHDYVAYEPYGVIGAIIPWNGPFFATTMVQTVAQKFGGVEILVNNAALMAELGYNPASKIPIDEWNRILNVNLTGALICAQAVVPLMQARGGGRIINQTSGGAFPAIAVYGIGKLALVGLTTTLARELGRENIAVNAIAPGNVTSDAGKSLTPDDSPFIKFLEMNVAMRVRGAPDELVGTLLLLCSQAGAWITGQAIHVDGGWVLRP
jgi:enoyl-[acyl-carrier-protein] reductase (NADH)